MSPSCSARNFPENASLRCRPKTSCFAPILLGLAVSLVGAPNRRCVAGQLPDNPEEFFNCTNLLTFWVELDQGAFQQLSERPKSYVSGRVHVGDQVWEHVGIRLKGSGTFQPVYEHPSLALKFNWKEAGQRFAGLNKLFLENSGQDATRMCKLLANAAYNDAGIAAPRITQARVRLNDRDLGRYVVSEAINKAFLKSHFGNDTGNLYEADFRDINRPLKQANGLPGDQSDVRALGRAVTLTYRTQRLVALGGVMDTDQFLNFLAV